MNALPLLFDLVMQRRRERARKMSASRASRVGKGLLSWHQHVED